MTALIMSPAMFCMMRTVMAVGHCSVIMRPPKPMVTWTSMENRKAEVNDLEEEQMIFLSSVMTAGKVHQHRSDVLKILCSDYFLSLN